MLNSETYLDFCFIREKDGFLKEDVHSMLEALFKHKIFHWYLDVKVNMGAEIVVAEVKGMSNWNSEQEVIDYLETQATDDFWALLQGFQFNVFPVRKGCS